MKCVYCKENVNQAGKYVCDSCAESAARLAAIREAKARTIWCDSCHAPEGSPCVSGSGVQRRESHARRYKRALKETRNASSR